VGGEWKEGNGGVGEGVDGREGQRVRRPFAQPPSRRAHGIARRIALGAPR
jgi:hypothetical protein